MRIVALSDQHGFLPDIPPCDLLIVAGDVCPDRFVPFMARHEPYQQKAWFDHTARQWLANAPATHKILTWGNHLARSRRTKTAWRPAPVHQEFESPVQIAHRAEASSCGDSRPTPANTSAPRLRLWQAPLEASGGRYCSVLPLSRTQRCIAAIEDVQHCISNLAGCTG